MRLLLDTHALIWWLSGDEAISIKARDAISDSDNVVFVSAASAMEIATKFRIGKLPSAALLARDFEEIIASQGFQELPINIRHARMAGEMNITHKDPFDRFLIAQAICDDLILVSIEPCSTALQCGASGKEGTVTVLSRLIANWVYGGTLAGIFLLLLLPAFMKGWTSLELLTFLHLPAYMLHQWEEHDNDRFRTFINREIGKGREVLSPLAVFVINVPGVWGIISLSLLATIFFDPGFALISVWLVLINGLAHLAQSIASRRYNPGLVTSALLFLPISLCTLWFIYHSGTGNILFQFVGIASSLAIHGAIIAYVMREKRRLAVTIH